jgi:hypothetical protein
LAYLTGNSFPRWEITYVNILIHSWGIDTSLVAENQGTSGK